jgi:hypothetical protein
MRRLSTSRARVFRRCPREHQLRYEKRLESLSDRAAARFGTLFHNGRDAWFAAHATGLRGEEQLVAALAEIKATATDETDEYELAKALALMVGYHERWGDEPMRVLGTEMEFEAPLLNPDSGRPSRTWLFAGKVDGVVQEIEEFDGLAWLNELKTSTEDVSPGSTYWERLLVDDQVSNYHIGAAALGLEVAGCIYDVAKRPALKPKQATPEESRNYTKGKACKLCKPRPAPVKHCAVCAGSGFEEAPRLYANQRAEDETPGEYYQRILEDIAANPEGYLRRHKVVRLADEVIDARRDLWRTSREIRETELAGYAPKNPSACTRFNSRCEYFPICSGTASASDPTLYRIRETELPELSTPTKEKSTNGTDQTEAPSPAPNPGEAFADERSVNGADRDQEALF